jgi:uncharacterized delta-60 repeat protein
MVLQPDGKAVVVGGVNTAAAGQNPNYDFGVVRLDTNGSLDTSFNGTGQQIIAFDRGQNNLDFAYAVALQPDGKIVLAGSSRADRPTSGQDFAAARLNADGSLDTSFGNSGKVVVPFLDTDGGPIQSEVQAVAVLPDGKIVLVGYATKLAGTTGNGDDQVAVALLDADGRVANQTMFGFSSPAGLGDRGQGVTVQPDGKIVVVGYTMTLRPGDTNPNQDFLVARLNEDLTFDSSFLGSSVVKFDLDPMFQFNNDVGQAVAIQPDGKIVLVGGVDIDITTFAAKAIGVARLNADGTLDSTFGDNGKAVVPSPYAGDAGAFGVALQPDGKILLGGYDVSNIATAAELMAVRLNANGSLDQTFGGGWHFDMFSAGASDTNVATALALQPDGRILLAGWSMPAGSPSSPRSFGVLRLVVGDLSPTQPSPPAVPPQPLPPAAPPQATRAVFVALGRGKKRKLAVQVAFDGGLPPRVVLSPFQEPKYRSVTATLHDRDGNGVADSVLFTARRGKKKFSRIVSL